MNKELQITKTYEDLKNFIIKISHESPNNMELGDKIREISNYLKENKSSDIKEPNNNSI